jgi:hypothetical protein
MVLIREKKLSLQKKNKHMKFSKILLLLVIAVSIVSCKSDDDGTVEFNLSNANIAGTHALSFFTVNREETADFNGVPVTSNTSVVGNTFQVTAVFGNDGTYTISGDYIAIITLTSGGVSQELDPETIVLDESGTYVIGTDEQTISLSGLSELGGGVFVVELFNETEFRITQMVEVTLPDLTSTTTSELRFVRQ